MEKSIIKEEDRIKVIFKIDEKTYGVSIPYSIAMEMPVLAASINFKEGKTGKFTIGFDTTRVAVTNLFLWKKCILEGNDWVPKGIDTDKDWRDLFELASRMGELSFFEDTSRWATLDQMADCVSDLAPEAMILYIQEYLQKCFYPVCRCQGCKISNRYEDACAFFKKATIEECLAQTFSEGHSSENPHQMIEEAMRLRRLTYDSWSVDPREEYKDPKYWKYDRYSYDPPTEDDIKLMTNWYSRSIDERKLIMCYSSINSGCVNIPKCTQKLTFYKTWSKFCTYHPGLAKFIWDGMERKELLESIGDVPTKRRSRMMKANFEEMCDYVKRLKPKSGEYDPKEAGLVEAYNKACAGEWNGYINSEEIALTEAKLDRYRLEKKKAKQREAAKEAKEQYREQIYTGMAKFHVDLHKVKNGNNKKKKKN